MDRNQKEQSVEALRISLTEAKAVFVADFKGLPMSSLGELRLKVRAVDGQFQVAKNTLIKIAAKDTQAESISEHMTGNNALGFTDGDVAALAKSLMDFARQNDKLVIKGGVLGDKPINAEGIKALASLPSREVLLATMLGAMQAVPGGLVRVLAAVPQKLVYALVAIRDQKEAA